MNLVKPPPLIALLTLVAAPCSPAQAAPEAQAAALFQRLQPAVVTVQVVSPGSGRPQSSGSGFVIDGAGRVLTNYHVVADHLRTPSQDQLRAVDAKGREWPAKVTGFDIAHDLAVLESAYRPTTTVAVPQRERALRVGEPIVSLGNPSRLGLTFMRGHFSSHVQSLGVARIHFSGTLNAGMSGGPAVDLDGKLVGINVSREVGGEQIGFLVPTQAARALLARLGQRPDADRVDQSIQAQLHLWQADLKTRIGDGPPRTDRFGPYATPRLFDGDLRCWSSHNDAPRDAPPVQAQRVICRSPHDIFLGSALRSGHVNYTRTHLRTQVLHAMQFARVAERAALNNLFDGAGHDMAAQQCQDHRVRVGPSQTLPVRMIWCVSAYRDFPGIYDLDLSIVTQDRPQEALVLRLGAEGLAWDTLLTLTRNTLQGLS